MDLWDRQAIELIGPAYIEFNREGSGRFSFIAVEGALDCRPSSGGGQVDFSWEGSDEGSPVSGRGWARLDEEGGLVGHIYFHQGDDSGFRARAER